MISTPTFRPNNAPPVHLAVTHYWSSKGQAHTSKDVSDQNLTLSSNTTISRLKSPLKTVSTAVLQSKINTRPTLISRATFHLCPQMFPTRITNFPRCLLRVSNKIIAILLGTHNHWKMVSKTTTKTLSHSSIDLTRNRFKHASNIPDIRGKSTQKKRWVPPQPVSKIQGRETRAIPTKVIPVKNTRSTPKVAITNNNLPLAHNSNSLEFNLQQICTITNIRWTR